MVWSYEVTADGTRELTIVAHFAANSGSQFDVDEATSPFVQDVRFAPSDGGTASAISRDDHGWRFPCASGCVAHYRFALQEAGTTVNNADEALAAHGIVVSPASAWLLRPASSDANTRFTYRVHSSIGSSFVSGIHALPGSNELAFGAATEDLEDSGFAAFGALHLTTVPFGSAAVRVGFAPDQLPLSDAEVLSWVQHSAGAVANYYRGQLPERDTLLLIMKGSGHNTRGETLGNGGPAVLVRASDDVNPKTTAADWVVTHELLHANFPDLGRQRAWLSEGLATYIEPVARARVGLVSDKQFWHDLMEGLPQGLPEAGDRGLENTHTWGRTYWGGALFCLVVDVAIRERTGNAKSLDDVLWAIGATGATDEVYWDIEQVLDTAERATGTPVFRDTYAKMALAPGNVDLVALFAALGVRKLDNSVVFDDHAEKAAIRRAITAAQALSH